MRIIRTFAALSAAWLIMVVAARPAAGQFFGPSGPMNESFLATMAAGLALSQEQRTAPY